jgi:hypothetical protein
MAFSIPSTDTIPFSGGSNMNRRCFLALTALLSLSLANLAPAAEPAKPAAPAPAAQAKAPDFTFSGPYTHENLTIFLVHGKDSLPGKKFLTLSEALEQKKLVVHETGSVNELSVENVSTDADVFIQSGDIVKGGRQDRVLGYDLIVSAKSGKVPVPSFCVEQSRWSKRGGENDKQFESNPSIANGKDIKNAINYARAQGEVWQRVREAQMKLEKNVGQSVQSKASPSSFQLTLEDKKLTENLEKTTKALGKITEGKTEVIGYVVAVNGHIDGADVYGSAELFAKIWPKLLKGCAVDALAEFEKDKKYAPVNEEAVRAFVADANQGKKETNREVSARVQVNTRESDKNVLIECRDKQNGSQFVRRNYFAK